MCYIYFINRTTPVRKQKKEEARTWAIPCLKKSNRCLNSASLRVCFQETKASYADLRSVLNLGVFGAAFITWQVDFKWNNLMNFKITVCWRSDQWLQLLHCFYHTTKADLRGLYQLVPLSPMDIKKKRNKGKSAIWISKCIKGQEQFWFKVTGTFKVKH